MVWHWVDIPQWTPLYIPNKVRNDKSIHFQSDSFVLLTTWKHVISSCKLYSISTMRTLTWECIEFGNFILSASIHLWNRSIENLMSSSPFGCDFVTSLILVTQPNCQVCSSLDHYSQNRGDFCTLNLNWTCSFIWSLQWL